MTYREKDIAYETPDHKYWVLRVGYGYEIYEVGITHSTRKGIIGFKGQEGLDRAIAEIERRQNENRGRKAP